MKRKTLLAGLTAFTMLTTMFLANVPVHAETEDATLNIQVLQYADPLGGKNSPIEAVTDFPITFTAKGTEYKESWLSTNETHTIHNLNPEQTYKFNSSIFYTVTEIFLNDEPVKFLDDIKLQAGENNITFYVGHPITINIYDKMGKKIETNYYLQNSMEDTSIAQTYGNEQYYCTVLDKDKTKLCINTPYQLAGNFSLNKIMTKNGELAPDALYDITWIDSKTGKCVIDAEAINYTKFEKPELYTFSDISEEELNNLTFVLRNNNTLKAVEKWKANETKELSDLPAGDYYLEVENPEYVIIGDDYTTFFHFYDDSIIYREITELEIEKKDAPNYSFDIDSNCEVYNSKGELVLEGWPYDKGTWELKSEFKALPTGYYYCKYFSRKNPSEFIGEEYFFNDRLSTTLGMYHLTSYEAPDTVKNSNPGDEIEIYQSYHFKNGMEKTFDFIADGEDKLTTDKNFYGGTLIYNKTQQTIMIGKSSEQYDAKQTFTLTLRNAKDEKLTTFEVSALEYYKMLASIPDKGNSPALYNIIEFGLPINVFSDEINDTIKKYSNAYCKLQTNERTFIVSTDKNNQLYCLGMESFGDDYYLTPFEYHQSHNSGDIDGNLELNVDDIKMMQNYLHKKDTLRATQMVRGDINKDGIVNIFDLVLLKRRVTNLNS